MRDLDSLDPQDLEVLYGLAPTKKPKRIKLPRWVRWSAVVLLAAACVAGAELLACRHFEPELYETVMEPVRETGRQASRALQAAWGGVCRAGSAAAGGIGQAASALADRAGEARDSLRAWMEARSAPPPEEAEDGEMDGPLAQPEITPPMEMLNPLVSNLVERGGLRVLTGGGVDVVYYNQTDEARADQKYGSDPLSTHGCGPTAMAMAVSTLAGEAVDPADMAKLCVEQGYWCKHHGSYLSIVQGVAERYGLQCESVDLTALNEDEIYTRLADGDLFVALMTKGHFTRGGHFILLRGATLGGEILVADPASQDRSLIPWELSLILEELSPSRHDGAPLWVLSKPLEE